MPISSPLIKIKAQANHHGWFLILIGCIALLIILVISHYFWRELRLILIYVILLTLVIILTGILKRLEPKYSLVLTPDNIRYFHKFGYWQLSWQQIQNISQVKETCGLTRLELPYIGIRLVDIESLINQISLRLANRLIHEQRTLIAFAIANQLLSLEQGKLNFSPYQLRSGKLVKGPLAAFLHHSKILYTGFGFHLFIPESSIDRDVDEFCQLLKQCKAAAHHYQ